MHVGHMACHVSTCMAHGEGYKYGVRVVYRSREQQEGKVRKKNERKRKERMRGKEKRERRRKGKRCSDGRNSSYQEVKFLYSMSVALQEVGILPTLVSLYP